MANKKRNKKNKKQKNNDTSSSSENSQSSSSSSNPPLVSNVLKRTVNAADSSNDFSLQEDGAIATDVSSHFESTPETTPDTVSSRLTKTTSEEIPEAFKVNPLFATEENLLSDAINSSEFITPPPGISSSPEAFEDAIPEDAEVQPEDGIKVDFCHVAENDNNDYLHEELKTEEVNDEDEEGFEEPIYQEEVDEGQFEDVIEEVLEDIYEKDEENIQEEVGEKLKEDLPNKIPMAKIEDFSEDEEDSETNNEPEQKESNDSNLMDQSEFDLDLNYDRQIRKSEISFEHRWALEERLIHYQPPVLPSAAPPKVFSEPKSLNPQFAPQFPVAQSVIPTEMTTSIPDLLTEDDQPVSNQTDIVPITKAVIEKSTCGNDSCISLSSVEVENARKSQKTSKSAIAIETSGLTLPIMDDPSKYVLERSNFIKSEFAEVQKAIETPYKMIETTRSVGFMEPGDDLTALEQPTMMALCQNSHQPMAVEKVIDSVLPGFQVPKYEEISESLTKTFIPKNIVLPDEKNVLANECLKLSREISPKDEKSRGRNKSSDSESSMTLPEVPSPGSSRRSSSGLSSGKSYGRNSGRFTGQVPPPIISQPVRSVSVQSEERIRERPRTDSSCQTDRTDASNISFEDPDEIQIEIFEPEIQEDNFTSNLLSVYRRQRIDRHGLDLKLKLLQSHQYVWIHKVLLEAILPGITQSHIFIVVDLDSDSLVALVQYLYTGQLGRPLSLDSCPSYLKILQALGDVKFIKDEIIQFMESEFNVENCDRIISAARVFNLEGLGGRIVEKIGSKPFEYRDIILKLDPEDFIHLVELDTLNIGEIDLLSLISDWLTSKPIHAEYIDRVLENVRWETIPSEYIVSNVISDTILTQGNGAKTIMEAMGQHLAKNRFQKSMKYRRNARETILVIGGVTKGDVPLVLKSDESWIHSDLHVPDDLRYYFNKLSGHQVLNINGFVFVIGGEYLGKDNKKVISNLVLCLDIRLRHWKELRPMIHSRTHFSASVLNDEIFVFGGRNEKGILAFSEKFSIDENKWSQIEKLRVPRCCHAQITTGGKIYISGGYVQEYKKPARYSSDILIYSGEESAFIEATTSLVQPRGWHKMVEIGKNILILGGCYQKQNGRREGISEVEFFDISGCSMYSIQQQLLYSCSSPSLATSQDGDIAKVLLIGGWSETEKKFLNSAQEMIFKNKTVQTIQLLNSYLPKHFTTQEATNVIF